MNKNLPEKNKNANSSDIHIGINTPQANLSGDMIAYVWTLAKSEMEIMSI